MLTLKVRLCFVRGFAWARLSLETKFKCKLGQSSELIALIKGKYEEES